MKILLSCINANGLGGSEMYHYELARELNLLGHDVKSIGQMKLDYECNTYGN